MQLLVPMMKKYKTSFTSWAYAHVEIAQKIYITKGRGLHSSKTSDYKHEEESPNASLHYKNDPPPLRSNSDANDW